MMEILTCKLCGNKDLYFYYAQGNKNQFKYFKCRHCKLVNYEHPQGLGLSQDVYESRYISPKEEGNKENQKQTQTYQYIKKHFKTPGKMMEIGCSHARILYLAQNDGWIVEGLELFEAIAKSVKKEVGINIEVANFLEYQVNPSDRYDLVILRHVLEHLPDPIKAMNQISALLKEDGYTLLEFPNIEGFKNKFKRLINNTGIHKKKYSANWVPGHCQEFCRKSIEFLLAKTGFVLIDYQTYTRSAAANLIYQHIHIGNKARVLARKSSVT